MKKELGELVFRGGIKPPVVRVEDSHVGFSWRDTNLHYAAYSATKSAVRNSLGSHLQSLRR